jgi:hypothetical protein
LPDSTYETLKLKAKVQPFGIGGIPVDPVSDGVQVLVEDVGVISQPLFDLSGTLMVPGGPVGSGCDPRDGWTANGTHFIYRNYSDAFPPACSSGVARGLQRVSIRDRQASGGQIVFTVVAQRTSPVPSYINDAVRVSFVFGDAAAGTAGYCGWREFGCAATATGRVCKFP